MNSVIWPLLVKNEDFSTKNFIFASKDQSSDLNFVMGDILSNFLKGNFHVVIVNLAQSSSHYTHMLLKSGVNIKILRDSQKFSVVNLFSEASTESAGLSYETLDLNSDDALKSLYISIKTAVEKACALKPSGFFIVIDEISLLLNLGFSLQSILPFVQYCFALCSGVNSILGNLFIGSYLNEYDSDSMEMTNFLYHLSDINIHVESLRTGYSKDTHGKIILQVKDNKKGTSSCEKQFFKVGEKGVKLLTLGL